ncbi:ATP-binding protein [Azospirillum agricola]|uniref:ATP-binding protein n=1 Tax=Azospirillum agricola TaxID=1720247 RepID=UPI000A0F3F70|nr:ATP-binding protein [Azospirillum agricola]SMH62697.1 Bacteriophytochrome (light-regulated signal transduction histidine kinase) [Azospirillum lipoferum]
MVGNGVQPSTKTTISAATPAQRILEDIGDTDSCAREPIHRPGSIQPHGHLLVFGGGDLRLLQASAHVGDLLGITLEKAFGQPADRLFPGEAGAELCRGLAQVPLREPVQLGVLQCPVGQLQTIAHRSGDAVILELEAVPTEGVRSLESLYPHLRASIQGLQAAATLNELMTRTAAEVRALTGFDRVLVYRFDEQWNGTVIAEDRNETLPAYLDLRFPASDIPEQARRLYTLNRLRLIVDASYQPVPILSPGGGGGGGGRAGGDGGEALDLSFSVLRSVSPVHLAYMRNMGTATSMSISVLSGDRLWGLISCHHAVPRPIPFSVRTACDLIGQVLSIQMMALDRSGEAEHRIALKHVETRLLAHMAASENFVAGLIGAPDDFLKLADAQGAAILFEGRCHRVGRTPSEDTVRRIAGHLGGRGHEEVFATHALSTLMPDAGDCIDTASGVLAISISQLHPSYVLWFRPELVRTVRWGGDPNKPSAVPGTPLSPRTSFETWKETVRWQAVPWRPSEIETVRDFRNAIVGIVLRKAEEMAALIVELQRSNSELTAFSYSVSHDLRAPFRHVTSYAELLRARASEKLDGRELHYLDTIIEAAASAGQLVDGLLQFSHLGRASLTHVAIDMNELVAEVRRLLVTEAGGRDIRWSVEALPEIQGDPTTIRLAFQNLLSNAIKYTRNRADAAIAVGCRTAPDAFEFFVRDNGSGFDMAYVHKLFGVFQRLHREEDFEGIGIGLANVRRIVERHGGRAWAEGEPGRGATFHISFPRSPGRLPVQPPSPIPTSVPPR